MYRTKGESSDFWTCRESTTPQVPLLVGHPDLPIGCLLRRVLGIFTVTILKRMSESIFFQINKITPFKVKAGIEVVNPLMVFSLLKISQPF